MRRFVVKCYACQSQESVWAWNETHANAWLRRHGWSFSQITRHWFCGGCSTGVCRDLDVTMVEAAQEAASINAG